MVEDCGHGFLPVVIERQPAEGARASLSGAFVGNHVEAACGDALPDRVELLDQRVEPDQVYFVVDGHHRVSVARQQRQEFIDAEVRECSTRVNITPDLKPEDLKILRAKVNFLEASELDRIRPGANIKVTIPDGFARMLEHIAVHRYFMGLDQKRDISEEEAVADWYDNVYMPIVQVIRECNILEEFPRKTEGDLYLWVLDHQRMLAEQGEELQPPEDAARGFIEDKE